MTLRGILLNISIKLILCCFSSKHVSKNNMHLKRFIFTITSRKVHKFIKTQPSRERGRRNKKKGKKKSQTEPNWKHGQSKLQARVRKREKGQNKTKRVVNSASREWKLRLVCLFICFYHRNLALLELEGGLICGTVKLSSFNLDLLLPLILVSPWTITRSICEEHTRGGGAWGTQIPMFSVEKELRCPSISPSNRGNTSSFCSSSTHYKIYKQHKNKKYPIELGDIRFI